MQNFFFEKDSMYNLESIYCLNITNIFKYKVWLQTWL